MASTKNHVFKNWTEAAANAKKLLTDGEIDHDEYIKILARAKKEMGAKGFADGGRPPVGEPSVVGERGPEMFVPDTPGTIVPNQSVARSLLAPLLGLPGDVANYGARGIHKATNFVERQFGLPESSGPDYSRNVLPTSRSAGAVADYGARGIQKGVNFVERQLGMPESAAPGSTPTLAQRQPIPPPLDGTGKSPSNQDFVFNNWTDAATHASDLFKRGAIDQDEYHQIMARAKAEQTNPPSQQGRVGFSAPNPMNGRAMPVQSLPTWEQVQRFMQELTGPRPAH